MNKEVEEIIQLGKDSIVQLALTLLDEKIEAQDFPKTIVMANDEKVYVSFLNPIKYLPINSVFYADFGVDLLEKVVSYGPVSNGNFDAEKKVPLYKQTKEAKKIIQFVIEAINKSTEVSSIDIANFDDDMTIHEYKSYYSITVVSEFQESTYKIEKMTGKLYDAEHAHLAPPPFENEDKLKEVH